MTGTVVILFVVFLIVAFVYEAKSRKQTQRKAPPAASPPEPDQNLLTADEAMPTQTGRFRAQQVIQQAGKQAQQSTDAVSARIETVAETSEEEQAPLPDPFSDNKQ